MNILETAIKQEGSVGALANALGLGQTAISNWRARGVPKPWGQVLQLRYGSDNHVTTVRSEDTVCKT